MQYLLFLLAIFVYLLHLSLVLFNVFKGIFYCRYALHILCAGALDAANKWTTNKWTATVLPIQNGWGDRRKGFN